MHTTPIRILYCITLCLVLGWSCTTDLTPSNEDITEYTHEFHESTSELTQQDSGESTPPEQTHKESTISPEDTCKSSPSACSTKGTHRCVTNGVQSCVPIQGCLKWTDAQPCTQGTQCVQGRCQSCTATIGSASDQVFTFQGEQRHYWIHIPRSYTCTQPTALLMDFHGTVGSSAAQPNHRPEETYLLPTLKQLAEKEGWIIVRPRSRSRQQGNFQLYQWDVNPGDLDKNVAFSLALVKELQKRYALDPKRLYASGFSTGSNMVSQFLGAPNQPFRGLAPIAGGIWNVPTPFSVGQQPPRIYTVTGYRDYLHSTLRRLLLLLERKGYPKERLLQRRVDAAHELSAWHMFEAAAWLDRGRSPYTQKGVLSSGWKDISSTSIQGDLLELRLHSNGSAAAVGTQGRLWYYAQDSKQWKLAAQLKGSSVSEHVNRLSWTGLCILSDGHGWAAGEGQVAQTKDYGKSWKLLPSIPKNLGGQLGYVYLLGLGCSNKGGVLAGGYWNAVHKADAAASWQKTQAKFASYDAQIAAVRIGAQETRIAVGYYYIGRGSQLSELQLVQHPAKGWLYDVATAGKGLWWAVGSSGQILHSKDDGRTWSLQKSSNASEQPHDLYAVSFYDAKTGVAVGGFGRVWATRDGGKTWKDISIGRSLFLGDVAFKNSQTIWAVGEQGYVFEYTLP